MRKFAGMLALSVAIAHHIFMVTITTTDSFAEVLRSQYPANAVYAMTYMIGSADDFAWHLSDQTGSLLDMQNVQRFLIADGIPAQLIRVERLEEQGMPTHFAALHPTTILDAKRAVSKLSKQLDVSIAKSRLA